MQDLYVTLSLTMARRRPNGPLLPANLARDCDLPLPGDAPRIRLPLAAAAAHHDAGRDTGGTRESPRGLTARVPPGRCGGHPAPANSEPHDVWGSPWSRVPKPRIKVTLPLATGAVGREPEVRGLSRGGAELMSEVVPV